MAKFTKALFLFSFIAFSLFAVYSYSMGMMGGGGMMGGMSGLGSWFAGEDISVNIPTRRPLQTENTVRAGGKIYEQRCAVCHGSMGDGFSRYSNDMTIKPRDFTSGTFKFTSSLPAYPPTDEDLFKTISRGLHGTAMLPWTALSDREKWATIDYIKTFSDVFEEEIIETVKAPLPARSSQEYVQQGRKVYEEVKCYECHGREGYGDGEKAGKLKDEKQRPIRPANFRENFLKRGRDVNDIYLTIAVGLDGTPMEAYIDKLKEDDILAAAYYIRSIARKPSSTRGGGMMGMMGSKAPDERIGMQIYMHGG